MMNKKIIIALDVDEFNEARRLIDILDTALYFKVGLRPFLKFGDELINYLKEKGKKVFGPQIQGYTQHGCRGCPILPEVLTGHAYHPPLRRRGDDPKGRSGS